MKEWLKITLFSLLALLALVGLSFTFGFWNLSLKSVFGVRSANIDREIFEENQSYIKGMASDLSKYKLEYTRETNPIAKKAILDYVRDVYSDFDLSNLHNVDLRAWANVVVNGGTP